MKKLLLTMMFCLVTLMGVQAENKQTLTINGEVVEKTVAKMTFDGDNVVLHFTDATQQSADMSTVVLSFVWTEGTSIHAVRQPVGDVLNIDGLEPGTSITIYDAAGKKVLTTTASEAKAVLSAKSLRPGVYLLKAGKQLVKFTKK